METTKFEKATVIRIELGEEDIITDSNCASQGHQNGNNCTHGNTKGGN